MTRLCKFFSITIVSIFPLQNIQAQVPEKRMKADDPESVFLNPPPAASPGVLWMWMGSNLSKSGITKDLEALKKQGFNRTTMFSLADITTPWASDIGKSPTPEIVAWTEPWWKMVRFAAEESKRLGMDFGMYNGPGYESSGGPWVTPELSMQEICWSKLAVSGDKKLPFKLAKPVVNLRGHTPFPVHNPETGRLEKPDVAARGTFYKDIAVIAVPAKGNINVNQVVNLTGKMDANGTLNWKAPAGEWTVYRFGHTTTGTYIQPAAWKAIGLECDKMSEKAVNFYMDHVVDGIKEHLGDLIGTGFTHVHFDSYEAGVPSWTPKMAEEFARRRGYDMIPYLATFAGRKVGNDKGDTLKFNSDFDATIKDLYRDVYFKTIAKKLKEANLKFLCEPYGGPWRQDDVMPLIENVMTEFWTHKGKFSPYELEPTVNALRKSGQNIVEAEAFTGDPRYSKWDETPAWIKPIGDDAFCAGVNRFVLHRFVQQPWDDKYKPAATMGRWGTHFDRTQTWWNSANALVSYWQRCQALLQWGSITPADKEDMILDAKTDTSTVKFIHRKSGSTDIYFVANITRQPVKAVCSFKITGMQPELWNPVTKTMRNLTEFEMANGKTIVPIEFDAAQSFFVVFRNKIPAKKQQVAKPNFPVQKQLVSIGGPWQVKFDKVWGGPAQTVTFPTLTDWTKNPDPGIKYYSGTAVYTKVFDSASGKQSALYLDLGKVNHLASVTINGKDFGIVWTAPWQVKIPAGALKSKGNQLTIRVTNVWANRLIGDEQEPDDCEWLTAPFKEDGKYLKEFPDWFLKNQPRPSKGRYTFTTWNYFKKDSPLISSGLLGPVRIMKEE